MEGRKGREEGKEKEWLNLTETESYEQAGQERWNEGMNKVWFGVTKLC